MAFSFRKALLVPWKPNVQSLRHRNKINIQRPALPHYERAKVLRVCQPTFNKPEKKYRPSAELCLKPIESIKKQQEEENPYANILSKELYNRTNDSKFVGFIHRNPTNAEEMFKINVALQQHNATMKVYGRTIAEKALVNTYYEAALCLFRSHTALVFGSDGSPKNVASILKTFRRVPSLLLMAAIVDRRLLDHNELQKYSQLLDLTTARAQLVAILYSAGGGRLVSYLTTHQNTLVQRLDQHAQQIGSPRSSSNEECVTDTPTDSK